MARDAELAEAHGRGDMAAYLAGLSERYVYIDVGGQRVTADTLEARRSNDRRRVVSSEPSEEEAIRLSDDVVLLRGLERSTASYFGGLPRVSTSRWSALWVREFDGVWRLTADTANHVADEDPLMAMITPQPADVITALAGRWALDLEPALVLVLEPADGHLVGYLPGEEERWTFEPVSSTYYLAQERSFELRFTPDGQSVTFVTWGTPTTAKRE